MLPPSPHPGLPRFRRWSAFGSAVGCALTLLATSLNSPAYAYTPRSLSGCTPITWVTQPKVVVHVSEFAGPDLIQNLINLLQLTDAMNDVHEQFNLVGATAAQVTAFEVSTDPFVYGTWSGGAPPTIHMGFTSNVSAAPGVTTWDLDAACNIVEAHIQFKEPVCLRLDLQRPVSARRTLLRRRADERSRDRYFRISYVHELLHAYGLAHSANSLSMLNYVLFSTDDVWDAADAASVTSTLVHDEHERFSAQQGRTWSVPVLSAGTYYVIARVEATTTSGVVLSDWIPLRGTVTVNSRKVSCAGRGGFSVSGLGLTHASTSRAARPRRVRILPAFA